MCYAVSFFFCKRQQQQGKARQMENGECFCTRKGLSNNGKKHIVKGVYADELLVVIAVIALLLAIIVPVLGKAKMYAQGSSVRRICISITLPQNSIQLTIRIGTRSVEKSI